MGLISRSLGIRAFSLEDPAQPLLPLSALQESLGLGRSDAGVLVNERQAMRLSPVFACFKIISEDLSKIPFSVYQRMPDFSVRVAPEHRVHKLLHDAPNGIMTAMTFRGAFITSALAFGAAFAFIQRDGAARVIALHPLPSDRTAPVFINGEFFFATTATPDGKPKLIDPENVLHMVGLTMDGITGYSPVTTCKNAVGIGLAAEKYNALFFGNGARATGVLTHPGSLDPEAQENLKKSVREWASGENALRPIILEEGLKWEQITVNPNDGQVIECVMPGTLISMADGSRRPVEQLRTGDSVVTWDGSRLTRSRVKNVGTPPIKQLVRITTARGRTLEASGDHPCLTLRSLVTLGQRPTQASPEWIKAGDLVIGNYIRTEVADLAKDVKHKVVRSDVANNAYLLGALIGDGYLRTLGCSFSNTDNGVIEAVNKELTALGASLRHKAGCDFDIITNGKGRSGSKFRRLIRTAGIEGLHAHTKRVPIHVLRGGPLAWAEFLSGLLDTDGSIGSPKSKQSPKVVWSSCNRDLLADCQHLLAMMGVQSGIYRLSKGATRMIRGQECNTRDSIALTVCGSENLRRLAKTLHLRHSVKRRLLQSYVTLPKSRYRETNNLYDRVISVEMIGEGQTIGIEIDRTHTHVTNGLVTHNTRKFQVEEIARLYRVPLHKLAELSRSSNNNIEHQGIEHNQDALQPWAVRLEQEVNRKLLGGSYFAEHDFSELERGDAVSQANSIQTLRNIGLVSTNDGLRRLRMNPIAAEDGGDIRIVQGANIPLSALVGYTLPVAPGPTGKTAPNRQSASKEEADSELGDDVPDKNAEASKSIRMSYRRLFRDAIGRSINRASDATFVRRALHPVLAAMCEAINVLKHDSTQLSEGDEQKINALITRIIGDSGAWKPENAAKTASRLTDECYAALEG